jgi:ABC-type lipoprotein export system ATPase subunit
MDMSKDFLLENVTKEYKGEGFTSKAINSISLNITHNKVTAIMGPSGSGKSTLLTLLGALDKPTHGSIHYGTEQLDRLTSKELSKFRFEEIGFVFQQFHLLPTLTAVENVMSPLFPHKKSSSGLANALLLLDRMGLKDKADSLPSQLSGGQQQRVALARSLINNPSWILADEPTGNLDSDSSDMIMKILMDIQAENQCGIIMVTHDHNIAKSAHQMIRVKDGKILEANAL